MDKLKIYQKIKELSHQKGTVYTRADLAYDLQQLVYQMTALRSEYWYGKLTNISIRTILSGLVFTITKKKVY